MLCGAARLAALSGDVLKLHSNQRKAPRAVQRVYHLSKLSTAARPCLSARSGMAVRRSVTTCYLSERRAN